MKPTIVPFVKWVGGKRQLLDELIKRVPKNYNTYFEPFLGGGALFFELQPSRAVVSDLNNDLINAYKVIKNKCAQLREYLLLMEYGHSEHFFKLIAAIDRNDPANRRTLSSSDSDVLRAARFIYLNKASFNGIYRVNANGHFNVPWGQKVHVKTFIWPNIELVSFFLRNNDIKLVAKSFESIKEQIKPGDFVYFDPPYDFEIGVEGFGAYQKEGFGKDLQIQLALLCEHLDMLNVKFMVSNHNTAFIKDLYKKFSIEVISAKRLVGGKGASRSNVEEVLITNYDWKSQK